jgi:DNA-binding beta-propeller fold protein YncE
VSRSPAARKAGWSAKRSSKPRLSLKMMHQTTGSTRSPAGWFAVHGWAAAILAVGLAALAVLLSSRIPAAFAVDNNTVDGLFCGIPLSRHLAAGATDTFNTSLPVGTVVSVDTKATDGVVALKQQSLNFTPATSDQCSGNLLLTVPAPAPGMDVPVGMINVTNCVDSAAHDYTTTLSVVSGTPSNCAVPLPCGMPLNASFNTRGEVDSYLFPGMAGDTISFAVTNVSPSIGGIRIRLFDPSGASIYDDVFTCPTTGPVLKTLPASGNYTALLSACTGAPQGQYTVTWQPSGCTPKQPPGQFAYVTNADSGTMSVVDLSSNTAKLTLPIAAAGQAQIASQTFVAITPNGGFAYATYVPSSTTSVVNTSTNLLVASVQSGFDANGVTVSPDGATAYIVSNSLGGIELVNTRTNKITGVVASDIGFSQGIAVSPDGKFLYVMSEDNGPGLNKINTTDYTVDAVALLELGLYDAFAISPDGSYAYAGTLEGIAVIDTSIMMTTDMIEGVGEPFAIAFTADGRKAYATIADNGVIVAIDTATHQVDTISNVGDSPGGIAISPETGLAYSTDFTAAANQPGVFVIDTKTNKVVTSLATLGDGPTGIALTTAPTGLCVGNAMGQTEVTIDELVLSVNYALNGCPGRFPTVSVPIP